MARSRKARPEDIDEICLSLPQVELGISWGDRPTYKVPVGPKGKGFLLYRAPHRSAINPNSGEEYGDLLVIHVADAAEKAALVEDPGLPFFTVDHFKNFNAVLVQQSRLGELTVAELREIITDSWATKAPKKLVREYFAA